jgi:hypothetical protein
MGIVDQNAKEYYDKIVDEQNPEKKAFNLVLAILVAAIFGWSSTFIYLKMDSSKKDDKIQELTDKFVRTNQIWNERFLKQDSVHSLEMRAKDDYYTKYFKDKLEKYEDKFDSYEIRTQKLKNRINR